MDQIERWWATGIFLSKDDPDAPEVFTLSVIVERFMDGEAIHKLLHASEAEGRQDGQQEAELVKVILTKGVYSPMEWWAVRPPEIVTMQGKTLLWGDGEGVLASTWEEDSNLKECADPEHPLGEHPCSH